MSSYSDVVIDNICGPEILSIMARWKAMEDTGTCRLSAPMGID
jgi:hypothetical protein